MAEKLTVAGFQQMKREGKKIVAVVCYDYQAAQIVDRAGVDLVSVGDSLGFRFLGQATHLEVTLDQMVLMCLAVSRGVKRAVVSCDLPFGPVQEGHAQALGAAIRLVKEGRAEMVKVDGAADYPEVVKAVSRAGIPVFAQFGFTPQTSQAFGGFDKITDAIRSQFRQKLVDEAKMLEEMGASCLDLTNAGIELSGVVARSVSIPVIGGFNTGPDTDGHVTVLYSSIIGYGVDGIDREGDRYANVGRTIFEATRVYADDVRSARLVKGTAARPLS